MKTKGDILEDLDRLIEQHYYSEDYELEWAACNYRDSLSPHERESFKDAMIDRLLDDPSMANIALCARLRIDELAPILTSILNSEIRTSQQSRAIMSALENYGDDASYESMERFMDSDQEGETLMRLCRMNFTRSLPYLRRAMNKEHMKDFCLHIFQERRKVVGLDGLIRDLQMIISADPSLYLESVRSVLTHKKADYNPFTAEDVNAIITGLAAGGNG